MSLGVRGHVRALKATCRRTPKTVMTEWNTKALIEADKRFVWHPFTDMREWCAPEHEPLVLVEGHGAVLRDSRGCEYIDGNSSIWTNIHGHNHPHINAAIRRQLDRVAHTSFLGFTNPPAIELAQAIVALFPDDTLSRVFFSDDGSTGIEVALRIADQYWRLRHSRRHHFVAFQNGYHGDTAGAASLGAAAMFQVGSTRWNFPAMQVPNIKALEALAPAEIAKIAAVVIEPLIQGAAGMRLWSPGTLRGVRDWCSRTDTLLIVDEVMTGFGRTGRMFASEHEDVIPDMMVMAKGLSGGYLPLAITLISEKLFSAFDGSVTEGKALAYGHSYTGNALACAAGKASLEVFENERVLEGLQPKIQRLSSALADLEKLPGVKEVRQCGLIAGIEIEESPNGPRPSLAAAACLEARRHGLLTRPLGNVIVLMPPLCITIDQITKAVEALRVSIAEVRLRSLSAARKNAEEVTP
jgi:adenosylmethionine-8-amino-7-oxononanoate aminotransferase